VPGDITETPDLQGAYPRLSDAQIAALTGQGDRRGTQLGEILFGEGERDCDFCVVLAGHVVLSRGTGRTRSALSACTAAAGSSASLAC
jgi:thioredoxin reductase (NADPH)